MGSDDGDTTYSVDYFVEADLHLQGGGSIQGLRLLYDPVSAHNQKVLQAIEYRRDDVKTRLREQGFNVHDFQASHQITPKSKHTDWADLIFPELVTPIVESRSIRMFQDLALDAAMRERVWQFRAFYRSIQRCLNQQVQRVFPDPQTACLMPNCRNLLIQPDSVEITREDFVRIEGDVTGDILLIIEGLQRALEEVFLTEGVPAVEAAVRDCGLGTGEIVLITIAGVTLMASPTSELPRAETSSATTHLIVSIIGGPVAIAIFMVPAAKTGRLCNDMYKTYIGYLA
ncbi:hypothetical protein AAF712_012044 [Marasmius tenuissimus]|uniref:Uncharacterized protein n=1 Tax=Marasmius tenuissimus TaxID=585030 RepID=A0ABR2ZJI1_9AGAR